MNNQSDDVHNYKKLDKIIHSGVRLNIVTILVQEEEANFNYLKSKIGASDGNLSLSLKKLIDFGYITERKTFFNRKPLTSYKLTGFGIESYQNYLQHLKELIFSKNL